MNQQRLEHQRSILNSMGIDIWANRQAQVQNCLSVDDFWRDQVNESEQLDSKHRIDISLNIKNEHVLDQTAVPIIDTVKPVEDIDLAINQVKIPEQEYFSTVPLNEIADFQFTAVRAGDWLILVDVTDLSEDELLLLNNITLSMNATQYHLRWPLNLKIGFEQPQTTHINMYIQGFLDSLNCSRWISLGTLPTGTNITIQQDLKMKSLKDMLDQPKYKQELWNILKI